MQIKSITNLFFTKYNYLLVIAAWLVTMSFIVDNYWSENANIKSVKNNIEKYIKLQEADFNKDFILFDTYLSKNYTEKSLNNIVEKKYYLFLYKDNFKENDVLFWSTQTAMPTNAILQSNDSIGFIILQNGYYVWLKHNLNTKLAVALIPIKWNYLVTNEYLKNNFVIGSGIENSYNISFNKNDVPVYASNNNILFYLTKNVQNSIVKNNIISVCLRLIAVFFIFLFIHFTAVFIALKNWHLSIIYLISIVLFLRILSYYFPLPLNFRQFELFNPAVYGSNIVLRSLGDLLINVVLLLWIMLFLRQKINENSFTVSNYIKSKKWILQIVISTLFIGITLVFGNVIKSMVADSQISFDVINFFSLNNYSFVGFIVLCCIAICYFIIGQILFNILKFKISNFEFIYFILIVAVEGLLLLTISYNFSNNLFELYLFIWLLIYLIAINSKFLNFTSNNLSTSLYVFWIFFFSLSITIIISSQNKIRELEKRKHYAEALSLKENPNSETLLNTLLTDFRNQNIATNFYKFYDEFSNHQFKDSLINNNFSSYTNKYDTKILTFDLKEKPLFNTDSISYNELNTILNTQGKSTSISDLFYYDESYNTYSYISRKNIVDTSGKSLGYIFILAHPKKFKTDALYPELFSKGSNNAIENSTIYFFAVYNKLKMVINHNDYPFETSLDKNLLPTEDFKEIFTNNYSELWYKGGPENLVIIVKNNNTFIEIITLFSYLFCVFLLLITIFWVINIFIQTKLNKLKFNNYLQLNIRNQIHGTVIFISILSFIIIGIATILFFIKRYNNNNKEHLSRTIHVMENEVRTSIFDISIFDDALKIYDKQYVEKLEQKINKISEIHDVDINLYDLEGTLKVSSLPLPYNKGILSAKMDPIAFYHLNKLKEVQFFKEEQIGKLKFTSNYVPVIDNQGKEYAYLNIPYFTSESKLKLEIANFLVTIINLNAFIFLLAGIVALFITNRITNSFQFISNRMKEINLGTKNNAIVWKRNDEIGALVNEYNKMLTKLEISASALAKSERELAWREMARQVAHEIKNPLTPMKLSLQYLQKAINNDAPNIKELMGSVAETVIEQINHLNQIAGEFSQFANIGNPRIEKFNLQELLKNLEQLYNSQKNKVIFFNSFSKPIIINADKTQINRLFTNLIQNAIQSVKDQTLPKILITYFYNDTHITLKITDNGIGIDNDVINKIFTPNFTTKTSGTGLGLAICKGIVEQAKGKIWFTTEINMGTTFFVELPYIVE